MRVDTENPRTGKRRHSNSAYLTMVAVDEQGNPVRVPPLQAASEEELRRESEAQLRRRNRLAEREQTGWTRAQHRGARRMPGRAIRPRGRPNAALPPTPARPRGQEEGAHEPIEVAVENALNVAHLVAPCGGP